MATNTKNGARSAVTLLRIIEQSVDAQLGVDEAASRVRRYVAEHDAPDDDRTAYARLCYVIFAQGLGFATVAAKWDQLREAFARFDPAAVAGFDEDRVRALMDEPIIRNEGKIRACIENARRWLTLAAQGSYVGIVASHAASDDSANGWPALCALLERDFTRVGEMAARQVLKRWGFFTACAHPLAQRVVERLGLTPSGNNNRVASGILVQRLIGKAAGRLGHDPYAVEATVALFAGTGPCRKEPQCAHCALADRCPTAARPSTSVAADL